MRDGMKEIRSSQEVSYLLEEPGMFFQTGYKVMRTQERNFLPCTKILYNGRDKLIYQTASCKPFESLLPTLQPEAFLDFVEQLLTVIAEVRKNGFLQCENMCTDFDHLYVNPADGRVHFIYLPVKTDGGGGDLELEKNLKQNIAQALGHFQNLESPNTVRLNALLRNSIVPLDAVLEFLQNREKVPKPQPGAGEELKAEPAMEREPEKPLPKPPQTPQPSQMPESKPEKRNLFPFRRKDIRPKKTTESIRAPQEISGGATEVLEELFQPAIMLQGINNSEEVEILITKDDFKIGKNPEAVDGAITFNKAISRQHCRILCRNGQYYIADMGSSNGTYLNGGRLEPQQEVPLRPGDKLKLANTNLIIKKV